MYHLYNMDCLEGIKKIESNSIDLIVSDPPYFIGMTHNGQKGTFNDLAICKPFYQELFKEYNRVLKDSGRLYFFTDFRAYAFYMPILNDIIPVKNCIIWNKRSGCGSNYNYQYEMIIYATKQYIIQGGSNIWDIKSFMVGAKKTNGEKIHPTQKPIELIEKIILDGSKENDFVLDTFSGSGTTAIACLKNNRHFIGFEHDENYYNLSRQRINKYIKSLKKEVA